MQKRKYRINALDLAIFIVVLCSVAVLVFSDRITEYFGTDDISMIDITLSVENASSSQISLSSEGTALVFEPETETEIKADALIKKTITTDENNSSKFIITCTGYKKFGRYFTENGDRVAIGSDCIIEINGNIINCKVTSVTIGS